MSETDDDFTGYSPNTKPSVVKRFVSKPPRTFAELVLTASVEGSEQMQIGSWEKDEVKPDIAGEIVDALRDYAEGMNAEAHGLLTFKKADGQVAGKQMPVKCTPDSQRNANADLLAADASELNGTYASQARQAQRFAEVSYQASLRAIGQMLSQMREISEHQSETMRTMAEALAERREAADEQRQRADDLEATIAKMEEAQGTDSEVSASRARIMKIVENVAPMVLAKFMSGGSGNTPPPTGG